MMLLATTTVTLRPPVVDADPYEVNPAPLGSDIAGVAAHIGSPSGRGSTSRSQVDAQLLIGSTPVITPATVVIDEATNVEWLVSWVDRRRGLGLDHQTAGLIRVGGADG
jgi:hypothetical protein